MRKLDLDFHGKELSRKDYEVLAYEHISQQLLDLEVGMFRTKWFDYRFMHPTEATYLFAHQYRLAYKRAVERARDMDKAVYSKGYRGTDIFDLKPIEITGFWKARQSADRLGIDYEFYISEAMGYAIRFGWKNFPRPQQLYSEKMTEYVEERWLEKLSAFTMLPKLEFFLNADEYIGQHDQIEFQSYLMEQIKAKVHPTLALHNYTMRNVVHMQTAREHFSQEEIDRALNNNRR